MVLLKEPREQFPQNIWHFSLQIAYKGEMQQKIVLGSHWWLWLLNNSSLLWSLIEKENHGIKRGKEWLVIVENQPFFTLPQKTVSASLIIGGI